MCPMSFRVRMTVGVWGNTLNFGYYRVHNEPEDFASLPTSFRCAI